MLIAIVFKKMPLFNVFQVPRNYFCLTFSVKLENGHEIGPKSIVVYEKIKNTQSLAGDLFSDARVG